ncbi:hypothetical protein V8F06_005846 [Rhypophila decipiens]
MTEFDEANNPLTEPHIIGNSFSMSGPTNWWLALRKSICGPDPAVVVTMCREPRSTRVPGSKGKKNPLKPTSNCSVDGWETHTESNHQGGDISRLSRANPRPCTITSVGEPPAVHDKPNRNLPFNRDRSCAGGEDINMSIGCFEDPRPASIRSSQSNTARTSAAPVQTSTAPARTFEERMERIEQYRLQNGRQEMRPDRQQPSRPSHPQTRRLSYYLAPPSNDLYRASSLDSRIYYYNLVAYGAAEQLWGQLGVEDFLGTEAQDDDLESRPGNDTWSIGTNSGSTGAGEGVTSAAILRAGRNAQVDQGARRSESGRRNQVRGRERNLEGIDGLVTRGAFEAA